MTDGSKGAWLGAVTIVTIALLWAAVAGTKMDTSCVHFEPAPPGAIVSCGVMFGVPCGVYVGAVVGALAGRLRELRRVILLLVAVVLASVLALLGGMAMQCSTDPSPCTLWLRAFTALGVAVLVLERWTRPDDPVPRARAL
jgi:hypothetical protein